MPAPVVTGGAAAPPARPPRPPTPRSAPPPARGSVDSDEGGATQLFAGTTAQSAELVVVAGTFKGKKILLGAGTVVIGRSSDCDLVLRAATGVSRRHCKVQYLGNRFVVVDLESRNGTIVNGQSVERKVLESGDRIEVGDETVQFLVETLDDIRNAPFGADLDEEETRTVPLVTSVPPTAPSPYQPPDNERTGDRRGAGGDDRLDDSGLDDSSLAETLPPTPSMEGPPVLPPPPRASAQEPYTVPREKKSKAPLVFAIFALLILGGAAFLIYDVFFSGPNTGPGAVIPTDDDIAIKGDAGVVATTDAGTNDGAALGAVAPVAKDAGVAELVDAGSVIDAGVAAAVAGADDAGVSEAVDDATVEIVRASAGGRTQSVTVKIGDTIKVGQVIGTVSSDNGSMERKLQALQNEERQFEAAAKADPAAKADLEDVRREMRRVQARLTPRNLKSDKAGTVVEILIAPGDVVRDAAPVLKVRP